MAWKHIRTAPYLLITLNMADRVFSSYVKTSTGKAAPTYEKQHYLVSSCGLIVVYKQLISPPACNIIEGVKVTLKSHTSVSATTSLDFKQHPSSQNSLEATFISTLQLEKHRPRGDVTCLK